MSIAETFTLGEFRCELMYDNDNITESPRNYDGNIGVLLMPHRRYSLGDTNVEEYVEVMDRLRGNRYAMKIFARYARLAWGATHVFPVGLLDHSGLHTWLGGGSHASDPGGWDSGTIGFYFDTTQTRAACYGDYSYTDADVEQALQAEFGEYAAYVAGECYGYVVSRESTCSHGDTHADEEDALWGLIGDDYAKREAKEALITAYHNATGTPLPYAATAADGQRVTFGYTWESGKPGLHEHARSMGYTDVEMVLDAVQTR